jgi:Flp pilus assembly protein CpaB
MSPPEGKHIISVRIPVEGMTPFVQPSSKVDLMATRQMDGNKVKGTVLIPSVLVMAVDTNVIAPQGGANGNLGLQMVSVAVTREEAMAIRLAQAAQAKLSFILRSPDGANSPNEQFDINKCIAWINDDGGQGDLKSEQQKPEEKVETATVKILVPKEDLKAGTELTSDVLEKNFKEINWNGTPPANAIVNIRENLGHFILKDVAAEQFVPKSYVAAKMPSVAVAQEPGRGKAEEGSKPQVKPDMPKPVEIEKLETFDRTISTVRGARTLRYEIQKDGKWKLLGEVTGDGNVVPNTEKPGDEAAPSKKAI